MIKLRLRCGHHVPLQVVELLPLAPHSTGYPYYTRSGGIWQWRTSRRFSRELVTAEQETCGRAEMMRV
ncbi:MAG: hypothetical protein L6435_07580 [Anaerolineae bacterium]|nr:hypothetical protein [Anaerolineae bacterium]